MVCTACACENEDLNGVCDTCGAPLSGHTPPASNSVVAHAALLAQRLNGAAGGPVATDATSREFGAARTLDIGPLRIVAGAPSGSRFTLAMRAAAQKPAYRIIDERSTLAGVDVREADAAAVWEHIASGVSVVRIECVSGAGATTLLLRLALAAQSHGFTGDAFVISDCCGPADDVAQRLTALLDPTPEPRYYTEAERTRLLDGRRVLVLLDRATLSATDMAQLTELFPSACFVVVSALALPPFPTIVLQPLHLDALLTLLESSYERRIDIDNRGAAADLCATLGSLPGSARLIGHAARRLGRSFISLRVQFASGDTVLRRLVASLPEREQQILAILALARAPLAAHHIAFVIRSGEIHAHLQSLIACELVRACGSDAYEVPRYVAEFVPPLADAPASFARLADVVCDVLDCSPAVPVSDRQAAAAEQLLREAAEDAQHLLVLKLGPRLADIFAARGEFGAWGRVLGLVEAAATHARDGVALSRARHELGVRALLLDKPDEATTYLKFAIQNRRSAGDDAGLAASSAMLDLAQRGLRSSARPPNPQPSSDLPQQSVFDDTPQPLAAAQPSQRGTRAFVLAGLCLAIVAILFFSFRHRPLATPVITQLSSRPTSLAGRRATQLCVDVRDAAVVEIFPDAIRLPGSGVHCLTVRPAATTTYVAVGTADDGQQVRRAVTVAVADAGTSAGLRIDAFSIRPARIKAGQSIRLCYAVTGAHLLRIVPQVGDLSRLRSCRMLTLREPHRYRYTLSATGDNGQVALRDVHVDVVAAAKRPGFRTAFDARLVRQAIYQFDATPSIVERGQTTSLCVGVDRPARGFVTHIGPLEPGVTRCYRVQPRVTTVYRLYVAVQNITAVQTVTVAVRPTRRREVARTERR